MKRSIFLPVLSAVVFAVPALAKPTSTSVAFLATTSANKGRHISSQSGGKLILGSTVISHHEIFSLVDVNGGALADGDAVQVAFNPGAKASYWAEDKGRIVRKGGKPGAASLFKVKWKQKNKTLMLRTAGGKFVSGKSKGSDLSAVSNASEPTAVFQLIKNPVRAPPRPKTKKAPAKKA